MPGVHETGPDAGGAGDAIHDEIDNRFGFHPLNGPGAAQAHERARTLMADAAHELVELVPEGRERALMLTSLDQSLMWANAGIARARPLEDK